VAITAISMPMPDTTLPRRAVEAWFSIFSPTMKNTEATI